MKKLLAMVLALVMTLSLAVSANAFKDDKSISDDYAEAVAVLNGMGVFKGYEDETFKPEGKITRAEVATIIYRIYTADVAKNDKSGMYATYNKFTDMAGAGWAAGYIGYCANAELVKGYPDGTFKPSGNVTGYEVLAMILRAVGYDKNGEFTGADWALNVAKYAEQTGVLKNIKGVDLNAPATRELVAEMLFRGIADAATVTYTPAFGYQTDAALKLDQKTLGAKNFKLTSAADKDIWGRPGTKWTYNTGDEETLVLKKAAATYTTKVDECDIAKDLGISSAKKIEAAYIDGVAQTVTNSAVTTDCNGKIDPRSTTSLVGGQGRLTEVYDMGADGYRLVEINTYLAKVTKVVDAKNDKNGHVDDAYIVMEAYLHNEDNGTQANLSFETEGFKKGQYVLVTITEPGTRKAEVQSVEAATVNAGGKVKSWTPAYGTTAATTTVVETKFNDADKFALGNFKDLRAFDKNKTAFDTIVDTYGNLIGLVESDISYAAIEKIEWKHTNNTIGGGKALADLVLADGKKVTNVEVVSIDELDVVSENAGKPQVGATVADDYKNNDAYYEHIYTYTIDKDGAYELAQYCMEKDENNQLVNGDNMHNEEAVNFVTGKTSKIDMRGEGSFVVANNNTVFAVWDEDTYSYTVYNGINELPSMKVDAGDLCLLYSGSYATFVVIKDCTLADNTIVVYAETQNGFTVGKNPKKYEYTVYPAGSTEPMTILAADANMFDQDGIYQITKNADGLFDEDGKTLILKAGIKAVEAMNDYEDLYWENGYVADFDGDSIVTLDEKKGDDFSAYRVNSATKYFTVKTTIWASDLGNTQKVEITASEAKDLMAEQQIIVAYEYDESEVVDSVYNNVAAYVYILETETNDTTAPEAALKLAIKSLGYDDGDFVVKVVANKDIAAEDYAYLTVTIDDGEGFLLEDGENTSYSWTAGSAEYIYVEYDSVQPTGKFAVTVTLYDADGEVVATAEKLCKVI